MPKSFFQFKQFKINQEKSSMKVCTDSCLFGAWVADKIETKNLIAEKILDIGSGTGLLSLMMAQKTVTKIDAVEINENSFQQTKENFLQSHWNERLQAIHVDIKKMESSSKYDLIISNPPFFENELKSYQVNINIAKHDEGLTLIELLQSIKGLLPFNGNFAVLLPYQRIEYFLNLATENEFYVKEEILVKQTPGHSYFRGILLLGPNPEIVIRKELAIKDEIGNYTKEFISLLKDYYLHL